MRLFNSIKGKLGYNIENSNGVNDIKFNRTLAGNTYKIIEKI